MAKIAVSQIYIKKMSIDRYKIENSAFVILRSPDQFSYYSYDIQRSEAALDLSMNYQIFETSLIQQLLFSTPQAL